MFTTYVLQCHSTHRFYTGSTSDFDKRMEQHNSGVSVSTKHRGPWVLVHREDFATLAEAVRRERYFKTGKGREELKRSIEKKRGLRLE